MSTPFAKRRACAAERLWVMVVFVSLFLLVVTAPLLVLGPVVADRKLGGAGSSGAMSVPPSTV